MKAPGAADAIDRMTDIHDIKSLASLGTDPLLRVYILIGIGILALFMVGIVLWNKRRLPSTGNEMVVLSPEEAALAALNDLADAELEDHRLFYFRLSAILRGYIEARQGINALEMTSEEFLPEIEKLDIDPQCRQSLKLLIRSTEPIKFAGLPADNAQMERDLAFVKDYVRQMTPVAPAGEDV